MDEFIEEYNLKGKPTGNKVLKSYAHKNGIPHSTIHLWLYTLDGELLIQKRSKNKKINPNIWDIISVAGHIGYSESAKDAVIREAFEEIGIKIKKNSIRKINTYFFKKEYNGLIDAEFHNAYICEIDKKKINLKFTNLEVDGLKFLKINEVKGIINEKPEGFLIIKDSITYYNEIIFEIESKINQNF